MAVSELYREAVLLRLVQAELMSHATARREFASQPRTPTPRYMDTRQREHILELVDRGFLSRRTAMGKLGIEDPDQEGEDIFMEKMMERPEVQAFIRQAAQQIARAKYPWRYRN